MIVLIKYIMLFILITLNLNAIKTCEYNTSSSRFVSTDNKENVYMQSVDKIVTTTLSFLTKPIYGNIDGKSTTSLLGVNSNYEDGDIFWVKVFDGDKVVGESDEAVLDGKALEFSDVELGGERWRR